MTCINKKFTVVEFKGKGFAKKLIDPKNRNLLYVIYFTKPTTSILLFKYNLDFHGQKNNSRARSKGKAYLDGSVYNLKTLKKT
jgi:hypothetical protein